VVAAEQVVVEGREDGDDEESLESDEVLDAPEVEYVEEVELMLELLGSDELLNTLELLDALEAEDDVLETLKVLVEPYEVEGKLDKTDVVDGTRHEQAELTALGFPPQFSR
jgi:flagellar biosynthesis regulator FlbT